MHVSFLSLLLLFTTLLQFAEVVVTDEQKDKYQLFRDLRKRKRPSLGRRQKTDESEERFLSTAFLHRVVDLKGTTTTTTPKPTGTTPTSPSITGPTTIATSSPPLSAPETIATSTSPLPSSPFSSSSRALDIAEKADGTKHIRRSEEDEDKDDFIPYTAANVADFAALEEMQRLQHHRRRHKLVKPQKRQKKLVKQNLKDHEL